MIREKLDSWDLEERIRIRPLTGYASWVAMLLDLPSIILTFKEREKENRNPDWTKVPLLADGMERYFDFRYSPRQDGNGIDLGAACR